MSKNSPIFWVPKKLFEDTGEQGDEAGSQVYQEWSPPCAQPPPMPPNNHVLGKVAKMLRRLENVEKNFMESATNALVQKVEIYGIHDDNFLELLREKAMLQYQTEKVIEKMVQYIEDKWKDTPNIQLMTNIYNVNVEFKNGERKEYLWTLPTVIRRVVEVEPDTDDEAEDEGTVSNYEEVPEEIEAELEEEAKDKGFLMNAMKLLSKKVTEAIDGVVGDADEIEDMCADTTVHTPPPP
jgi:hypothetical protein